MRSKWFEAPTGVLDVVHPTGIEFPLSFRRRDLAPCLYVGPMARWV